MAGIASSNEQVMFSSFQTQFSALKLETGDRIVEGLDALLPSTSGQRKISADT